MSGHSMIGIGRPERCGACFVVAVTVAGCGWSGPARVYPPRMDPVAVVKAVMEQADTDSDGFLIAAELNRAPALVGSLGFLDADGDKRLSSAELTAWLKGVQDSRIAITTLDVMVVRRGTPVPGATVKIVPEPFMGEETKSAEGVTDSAGVASLSIFGSGLSGVNCGLYRLEVTGIAGGSPIPAKYNTATKLGVAVGGVLPPEQPVRVVLE